MKKEEIFLDFLAKYFHALDQSVVYHTQSAATDAHGKPIKNFFALDRTPLSKKDLLDHIRGKKQFGISPLFPYLKIDPQQKTRVAYQCFWCCIDYDDKEASEEDREKNILDFYEHVRVNWPTIFPYIERSKSKGYHVWFFFADFFINKDGKKIAKKGLDAETCRLFAEQLIRNTGLKNTEVFPKQIWKSNKTPKPGETGVNYFGNCLNLPLCGLYLPKGGTAFCKPIRKKDGSLSFSSVCDLSEYIQTFKYTSTKIVKEIVENIQRESLPSHIDVGIKKSCEIGSYEATNILAARERCYLLQQMSTEKPDPHYKLSYQNWFAVCSNLTAFKNWEEIVNDLFVNNDNFPKSIEETKEKVVALLQSGRCFRVRCEKSGCPRAGKPHLCPTQSIGKALSGYEFEKCPYSLDDPNIDWIQLKEIFYEKIGCCETLKQTWEKGLRLGKDNQGKITSFQMDFQKDSFDTKRNNTLLMLADLLSEGMDEELIYQMIPYFKYGLHKQGSPELFWSLLQRAKKAAEAANIQKLLSLRRICKSQEKVSAHMRYVPGIGGLNGVFVSTFKEDKENPDAPPVEELIQITDFVIKRKGVVVDPQLQTSNDLIDYYPKMTEGVPIKDLLIDINCRLDLNLLLKELNKTEPDCPATCLAASHKPSLNIMRINMAAETTKGKLPKYIKVSDAAPYPELETHFFGNSYLHNGIFHHLAPDTKILSIEGKKCWISYLHDKNDSTQKLSNLPCPSFKYLQNERKLREIRDNYLKWLPFSWGGDNRYNSYLAAFWMIATLFKREIQTMLEMFPFLYIGGNISVGKNYQARLFALFLGILKWEIINVNSSTEAGLIRRLAPHKVLWIDEFKPGYYAEKIQEMLKAAFDNSSYVKADVTNQSRTISHVMNSALFFTSQSRPSIEAFESRSILTHLDSKWRTLEENVRLSEQAHFSLLEDPRLGGHNISELASWILKRKQTEKYMAENLVERIRHEAKFFYAGKENLFSNRNERAAKKAAILTECGKLLFPEGDFPNEVFGFEDYKKGKFTGIMKAIAKTMDETKQITCGPLSAFFDALMVAVANAKETLKFVFVVQEGKDDQQEEMIYFCFSTAWSIFIDTKKKLQETDTSGKQMHYQLMEALEGFLGKKKAPKALQNVGINQIVFKYKKDKASFFEEIKGAALTVQGRNLVKYEE